MRKHDVQRHINSKHHQDSVKHECPNCGKTFNRKDNLKQHQSICQAIRFKCPRCHRILRDIASLTQHMGLCPVPTCTMCQEQFVELNQLQEHRKTHTKKRKTASIADSKMKKRRRRNHGDFHCRVCLDSFITREELFHHKLEHLEDPRPYQPVEAHFNWEDERMNSMLRENAGLIFTPHRFTPVSADFNFPVNLLLKQDGWINEIYQTLDLVDNINNDESFKINLSMGFILVNRDTAEYRFFVPHANNAFFKKPVRIERPSSWRELYSQLDEESLKGYVTHHRESTTWIPLMMTNIMIHTFYLGTPMGNGKLPQYIKDS